MQNLLPQIFIDGGLTVNSFEPVTGGDINTAYCLHTKEENYFLKLNDASRFPQMFKLEADGLNALRNNSKLVVPETIKYGTVNNRQWLLLQWIEKGSAHKNTLQYFGAALAHMHKQNQDYFGWHTDNYIGSLVQTNTQNTSWEAFYTQCRILPLAKKLFDCGTLDRQDILNAETFCSRAGKLFPEEPPALLHGDLWGGNYMINTAGNPVIFDPAVYCGHREMDIGMTKLFGGFAPLFYDAYNEAYPLEKGWQQRFHLTQLYPLLVHAVLFGGHYISSVKNILASQ